MTYTMVTWWDEVGLVTRWADKQLCPTLGTAVSNRGKDANLCVQKSPRLQKLLPVLIESAVRLAFCRILSRMVTLRTERSSH